MSPDAVGLLLPVRLSPMAETRSQELIWYASQRADRLKTAVDLAEALETPVVAPYAGTSEEQVARIPTRWALRIHPDVLNIYAKTTSDILALTRWFLAKPDHEALRPLRAVLERELSLYQHALLVKQHLPDETVEMVNDLAEPDILNELTTAPLRWLAELDIDVVRKWQEDWDQIRGDLVGQFGMDEAHFAEAGESLKERMENLETDLAFIRTQLHAVGSVFSQEDQTGRS